MTVTTRKRMIQHIGNGLTREFPYDFIIPNEEALEVYLTDTTTGSIVKLDPSVFSVTGIGEATFGEVTYPLSGPPIGSHQTLTIRRTVEYDQNTSIRNQSGFFPDVIEDALDHLTYQTQQNADDISRATVIPLGETADMTLPAKNSRRGRVFGFDEDGEPVVGETLDRIANAVASAYSAGSGTADMIAYLAGSVSSGILSQSVQARLRQASYSTDYGAIADGTSHPVSEWLGDQGEHSRGFADLADIQAVYPHVTSLTDEIDWAACQALLNNAPIGGTAFITGRPVLNRQLTASRAMDLYFTDEPLVTHDGIGLKVTGFGKSAGYGGTGRIAKGQQIVVSLVKATQDHSEAGSIGLQITDTQHCIFTIRMLRNFTTNLHVLSVEQADGCTYNTFLLQRLHNGKVQIKLDADDPAAFVNQNTFIGGRLHIAGGSDRTDYYGIDMIGGQSVNNNTFVNVSIEDAGAGGNYIVACRCDGVYNNFFNMRSEGSQTWEFGPNSTRNRAFLGPFTSIIQGHVTDNGNRNQINTFAGEWLLEKQGAIPHLSLSNTTSDSHNYIEVVRPNGNVAWGATANGIMTVRDDAGTPRLMAFGTYTGDPGSDLPATGSVSWVRSPQLRGPLLWVRDNGGTFRPAGIVGGVPAALVTNLSQTISNPPTQAEVQALSDKVDELLGALRTANLMQTS